MKWKNLQMPKNVEVDEKSSTNRTVSSRSSPSSAASA